MALHFHLVQFQSLLYLVLHLHLIPQTLEWMTQSVMLVQLVTQMFNSELQLIKLYVTAVNDFPTFCIVQPIPFLIICIA